MKPGAVLLAPLRLGWGLWVTSEGTVILRNGPARAALVCLSDMPRTCRLLASGLALWIEANQQRGWDDPLLMAALWALGEVEQYLPQYARTA